MVSYSFYSCNQEVDDPYNPEPLMEILKAKTGEDPTEIEFLVFGDSKGSKYLEGVLKCADALNPDFCLTTGDLVNKGGGKKGKRDYKLLDKMGGWFLRKYPVWPTMGNHEELGGENGVDNFTTFFGMNKDRYSFEYGNAKFIALPFTKINKNPEMLKWLENELKTAKGKHIFIYKHRPNYTVGKKSYDDVEGSETETTKLYDKYKVKAVFSGHDHIYYRTKRNTTNYIISAGAGAPIYPLDREKDAIKDDVYYGERPAEELKNGIAPYKFHAADGTITDLPIAMYYVLSVKIKGDKVSIEMIDVKTGKVWDKADI